MVDAHEADRQARGHFAGDSGLEQADYALFLLSRPHQQNVGLFRL